MRHHHLIGWVAIPTLLAGTAFGQEYSPAQPPFSATPQALLAACAKLEPGSHPATVLLEEGRFDYDSAGRQTFRYRMIFKVLTKTGGEDWAMIERTWAPWKEERPQIHARVIAKDGSVHELDQKTIADSGAREGGDDVLTDQRTVRAPLPAMEPESVVEEEIVTKDTSVPLDAGTVSYFHFGNSVPVERSIVSIRGPEKIPLRFKVRLMPDLAVTDKTENGIREIVFNQGPMKPLEDPLPLLPADEPHSPHIVFSTAPDWHTVAQAYADVVERQLRDFDASRYLPKFAAGDTREAKILAIVNLLNKDIRYTGIEFSESSIVPHKPAEVLEHKYGDCKDKSTLAVALLRAAGIDAHLALLNSSTGEDVEPDLPGMGAFNHAIVYVPGPADIWLDPTDPYLRLGTISPPNQGRNALVAWPRTTALLRTPELTAQDNRVTEVRSFELSEFGRAKVTESSEAFGDIDRDYRGSFRDQDEKALRKTFKDYVEWTYGEAKIHAITAGDAADLTKPYPLKIELDDAQRGTTARTEAAVAVRIADLSVRLPEFFRTDPKAKPEKDETKPEPKPRTSDFVIPEPYTYEWHYVIHAPVGFRVRQLPEALEEKLGLATLAASFKSENATSIQADFKFVMPKRRFSAAEGLALRDASVELGKRKMMLLYFDQIGETDLASGNVKGAIAEFAALRKLHPNEALHAMQTAHAMLAAGAGERARAEARRAVALEPKSAQTYVQLAEVLKNDLVGRPMEKGLDRDGAVAAYRKALELDPDDVATRINLAILLEYDQFGNRYGKGAKLDEAIAEYAKVQDKLAQYGLAKNYPVALLRAGRIKELKEHLAKQPENEDNQILNVCAEAMLAGVDAGVERAGDVSGVEARRQTLTRAAQTLMVLRRYDLAAGIMTAAAAGAANPASVTNLIEILHKARRVEEMTQTIRQPEDLIAAVSVRVVLAEEHDTSWWDLFSPWMTNGERPEEMKTLARAVGGLKTQVRASGLTLEGALDIGLPAARFSRDGSDDSGWVVRMIAPGMETGSTQEQVWFVIREDGHYHVLAAVREFSGVARLAWRLADQGKTEEARVWLDRVRRELHAGSGDDPLSGPVFSRVWQQGQPAGADKVRLAAALLLSREAKGIDGVITTLEQAAKSADPGTADAVAASLAEAYFTAKQYQKSLVVSEALLKKLPQSASALRLALEAAYAAGGEKEAARIADPNLSHFDNDVDALRSAAAVAMRFGDTERSIAIEKRIVDSGRAHDNDYNQLAWAALMAGHVTEQTIETANRGMLVGNNKSTALMHTLAAVDAELDRPAEARATLLQRMEASGEEEPDDDDWYVFGRIAECYGLTGEASAMYRRLERPKDELHIPASSYALAQKRLKLMGASQ